MINLDSESQNERMDIEKSVVDLLTVKLNEDMITKLQEHFFLISKKFNFEANEPNLLITVNSQENLISFQYGKYLNSYRILFQIKKLDLVHSLDSNLFNLPVLMQDFSVELLLKKDSVINSLLIILDNENFLNLRMPKKIDNAFLEYTSKEIQVYNSQFVNELIFCRDAPIWKFTIKKDAIGIFKNFMRAGKNKKYKYKFFIKKLNYNKLELKVFVSHIGELVKIIDINSVLEEFPNQTPLRYKIEDIVTFIPLLDDSAETIHFSVDKEGHLIIEQIENDFLISGKFSIIQE